MGCVSYHFQRDVDVGDVPSGPYYHGSRRTYAVGAMLLTDVVNNLEGEEDDRQMCFATTSVEQALDWAYRRGIRHGGAALYVYEVEMLEPVVDVNVHRPGISQDITSVMSPRGRVVRLAQELSVAKYRNALWSEA